MNSTISELYDKVYIMERKRNNLLCCARAYLSASRTLIYKDYSEAALLAKRAMDSIMEAADIESEIVPLREKWEKMLCEQDKKGSPVDPF